MIGTTIGNSLIWDNGTNVGIGNTNTSYTLDVSGTGRFTSTLLSGQGTFQSTGANIISKNTTTSQANLIRFDNSVGTARAYLGYETTGTDFYVENAEGKLLLAASSGTAMTISGLNVGIGTSSPSTTLDVNGATKITGGGNTLTLAKSGNYPALAFQGATYTNVIESGDNYMAFYQSGSERMRIASNGGLVIGDTSISGTTKLKAISGGAVNGNALMFVDNGIYNAIGLYSAGADGYNGAVCVMIMGRNTTNSRSINAGGTINASGTDYAEYMTKAIDDNIEKGDIVGVDDNGLLTNIFLNAKSFVVKSTNPSYVGGDTWGNVDIIGKLPLEATDEEKAEYESKLEDARAKVDRIAFSGQVPCNVLGANVGDYIIPINDNGTIKGQAVTNPTFEQYQLSVGKVWKIMEDGRAWIAVKIG